MEKQLYYDKSEGALWYEGENGEELFYAWLENATVEEVESAIEKTWQKE